MRLIKKASCLALSIMMAFMVCAQAQPLNGYTKQDGYQYVQLGSYPQAEDGTALPIKWRVLEVSEDSAFLFSEYVLFNHRVHDPYEEYEAFEGEFKRTEIFGILNGEFLNSAFTAEEQALLMDDAELGRVFLVTSQDLGNKAYGFTTNKSRQGFGTPYALANGLFKYRNTSTGRASSPFWTRTRSTTLASGVRCTKVDGSVGYIRCVVMNEGIRPAIRIPLKNGEIDIQSGEGTLEAPYVLQLK